MINMYIGEGLSNSKKLYRKDKRRLRKYPNLKHNLSFRVSRSLKYRYKLKDKICIAHKNNISVIAKSKQQIGIDIEELKKRDFILIMNFCFNKKEKKSVFDARDKMLEFYKIYTFKEAFIKYKNLDFSHIKKVDFFGKYDMISIDYFMYKKYMICLIYKG